MFKKVKNWFKNQFEYSPNDIEQSLINIIENILKEESIEIYTPVYYAYFIKFNGGICRITDATIKIYCKDKLVLHDVNPYVGYKVRQLVRNKINEDVSIIEKELDKLVINFINNL